jgi:anti-sigma factor RsiW
VLAALVTGGALLLAMVATAGYAARALPPGARVPLNAGMPEHSVWLPRLAGLAAWLGVGAAAFAALAALTLSGLAANWAQSLRVVLLPGVMTVVLAAEAGAVIVARGQARREPGTTGQPGTEQAGTGDPGADQPGTGPRAAAAAP